MLELLEFGELGNDLCNTTVSDLLVPQPLQSHLDFAEKEYLKVSHLAQARGYVLDGSGAVLMNLSPNE